MFASPERWDTLALKDISGERICCIIGAGYSSVYGFPLGVGLLDISRAYIKSPSALKRFQVVAREFAEWRNKNRKKGAEQYLTELYNSTLTAAPFEWALELVMAVLAGERHFYENRITIPCRCEPHIQFWEKLITTSAEISVITLNYDILIERCLRHRHVRGWAGNGCYYGGIPRPQILKGKSSRIRDAEVEMTGTIPVFKLHGSMNWSVGFANIDLYQDTRPFFLLKHRPAIIPPIEEKKMPTWLTEIWQRASSALSNASTWLVCGYSLPDYDYAVRKFMRDSLSRNLSQIVLADPNSHNLKALWQSVAPSITIKCLPGLPECLRFMI